MDHAGGSTDAERALRKRRQHAAHGNETILLFVYLGYFHAQIIQTLLQLELQVVKL